MKDLTRTFDLDVPCDLVPLTLMRAGQVGRIGEVVGNGTVIHRLREMGMRGGALIRMVRPGCPCIVRLDGQKLCFRTEEAAGVLVQIGAAVPC